MAEKDRTPHEPSSKSESFLVGMVFGLFIGVLVVDVLQPGGVVTGIVFLCLTMLSLASGKRSLPFLAAMAFSSLVAYDLLSRYDDPHSIPLPEIVGRALVIVALWMTASVSVVHKKIEDCIEELKTLLHLCPSCKKIRDEKGAWQKLEDYLLETVGRETASGFCPQCRTKWHAGHALKGR